MISEFDFREFDFSGKRVRRNGKVLSKIALMFWISEFDPCSCYAIYDCYPYADYANKLKDLLS